jgi:CRP/FNR family transcriptional regulator, cyclic AMP receptor protein
MKKILLIEDNHDMRENIAEILELANYKVFTAENGKAGVQCALQELPDLVICDIMMPELDGYGVIHLLNKNPKTRDIPFIFLTAKSERNDYRKGIEMGADDYITKPFEEVELLNAIEIRLKKAEAMSSKVKEFSELIEEARGNETIKLTSEEREVFNYKKKQNIYTEGHRPVAVYQVLSGKVKIFKINDEGKELITNILSEKDFMGYNTILDDTLYQDNAEALEDTTLMVIPKSDFQQLINNDMQVARQFIRLLSHNIAEKEEQLLNLAYYSLRKRVAISLVQLFDKFKTAENTNPALEISREDLAQVIGTAKESLIRTLSDFKSEKLIDIRDSRIIINEEKKLRNLLY